MSQPAPVRILSDALINKIAAGEVIERAIEKTISQGIVTYDLARQMPGAREVPCSGFADAVAAHDGVVDFIQHFFGSLAL